MEKQALSMILLLVSVSLSGCSGIDGETVDSNENQLDDIWDSQEQMNRTIEELSLRLNALNETSQIQMSNFTELISGIQTELNIIGSALEAFSSEYDNLSELNNQSYQSLLESVSELQILVSNASLAIMELQLSMDKIDWSHMDLSEANLQHATLTGALLRYTILTNANLTKANLVDANLSNADLSSADLSNTDLSNADLSNADLSSADLTGANLSNADLSNAKLRFADITGTNLYGADFDVADFNGLKAVDIECPDKLPNGVECRRNILIGHSIDISGANLSFENLTGLDFTEMKMHGVRATNLTGCSAVILPQGWWCQRAIDSLEESIALFGPGANLSHVDIINSNLSNSELSGANFSYSLIRTSDFNNSILSRAQFNGSTIEYSFFSGTELSYSYLSESDIQYSDFSESDIQYSDFSESEIGISNFSGSGGFENNFSDAYVVASDFTQSTFWYSDFTHAGLWGADFSSFDPLSGGLLTGGLLGSDFTNATLVNSDLSHGYHLGVMFVNSTLSHTDLSHSDLILSNFSHAHLRFSSLGHSRIWYGDFNGATLTDMDLSGSELTDADLSNLSYVRDLRAMNVECPAHLPSYLECRNTHDSNFSLLGPYVDMSNQNISGWNLTHLNLSYSSFENSQLIYTNFSHTNLVHADLSGANLVYSNQNTWINPEQIDDLFFNSTNWDDTECPDGRRNPTISIFGAVMHLSCLTSGDLLGADFEPYWALSASEMQEWWW